MITTWYFCCKSHMFVLFFHSGDWFIINVLIANDFSGFPCCLPVLELLAAGSYSRNFHYLADCSSRSRSFHRLASYWVVTCQHICVCMCSAIIYNYLLLFQGISVCSFFVLFTLRRPHIRSSLSPTYSFRQYISSASIIRLIIYRRGLTFMWIAVLQTYVRILIDLFRRRTFGDDHRFNDE